MVTKQKEDDVSTKQQLDQAIQNGDDEQFVRIFEKENYYEKAAHVCYNIVEGALIQGQYDIARWVFDNTDIHPSFTPGD